MELIGTTIGEVKSEWEQIIDDLHAGKIRVENGYECAECFGAGFRYVPDPKNPLYSTSEYRGVARCSHCRYWELRASKAAANQ